MRLFVILCLFLAGPAFSSAQTPLGFGLDTGSTPTIESQPQYPAPGEVVELSINDYSSAIYGGGLTWFLNDTPIPGTQNVRKITVTAPAAGSRDTVKLVIKGNTSSQTITKVIAPHYLDIIIEPETHVPGFYKGRALPSGGSTVRATALLNDGVIKQQDLVYLWEIGETVYEGGPIRNRNVISVPIPDESNPVLRLQVSLPSGEVLAKRAITIPTVIPLIRFYEINALYGVETRAITDTLTMIGDTSTVIAEPYYLDSNTFNYPGILEWEINTAKVQNGGANPYIITLQKTGYTGTARVRFHVRNLSDLLRGGEDQFKINI